MKPFSSALATLFDTRTFVSADLYTFILPGGGSATLTSADQNIVWNGVTYLSGAPRVDRSPISEKTGLQVSSIKIDIYPGPADSIFGIPWQQAIKRGYFDGASVEIDRAFAPVWGEPITGTITMLKGRVADATVGRSKVEIEVNSWTELLSNQMPRRYYQSGCNNTLGDACCGVNRSLFAEAGTILSVVSPSAFYTTNPCSTNWLAYGVLTMTSGACNTESRPVSYNSGLIDGVNAVQLQIPLSLPPAIGDTFISYAGCDKTMATCQGKFNNLINFAGYPFIPSPTLAV